MPIMIRAAAESDIAAMASLRAETWGSEAYWKERIGGYLNGAHSPHQALAARAAVVAIADGTVAGFIAGHRTKRFGYDGNWSGSMSARRAAGRESRMTYCKRWRLRKPGAVKEHSRYGSERKRRISLSRRGP
jgi:hypothetical protein